MAKKTANPYSQNSGNKFSPGKNPFGQSKSVPQMNRDPEPEPPRSAPSTQSEQMDNSDPDTKKVKTGYIHAIAGLEPMSNDNLYRIGFDEGMVAKSTTSKDLDWRAQGNSGIISATSSAGTVYVAPHESKWVWWVDHPTGVMTRTAASLEDAVAEAERQVSTPDSPRFASILSEIVAVNPSLPPVRAVRLAHDAHHLAMQASLKGRMG